MEVENPSDSLARESISRWQNCLISERLALITTGPSEITKYRQ